MAKKEKQPLGAIERLFLKIAINKIIKKLNNMELKGSWKTSLVGWLTILGVLISCLIIPVLDGNPATNIDLPSILDALKILWPGIPAGIIGILARGKEVSSSAQAQSGTKMK